MKVEVHKYIFKTDKYSKTTTHKIIVAEKCCDEILDGDYIALTTDEGEDYGFKLSDIKTYYDYGDCFEQTYYKPIKYCPFCGKPLEVIIDDTFDLTEEYNRLYDERDRLWKLCNN